MSKNKRKNKFTDNIQPLFIEIPGYLIEAEIDFPKYHPHRLWRLAYICELLKGISIFELKQNPPWPYPNDHFITNQIIKELIDENWLIPQWNNKDFLIADRIKKIYEKNGEIGLYQEFLSYETIKGEWWIDAISGNLIPRLTALHYDIDFSRREPKNLVKLKSKIDSFKLLENKNLNIFEMISALEDRSLLNNTQYSRAYISSPIKVVGEKSIRFKMYGDARIDYRILPNDLSNLEYMLYEEAPYIFGEKRKIKLHYFKWKSSVVERFALHLEKLPDNYYLFSSEKYLSFIVNTLLEELKNENEWIEWFENGQIIEPIVGETNLFFDCLYELSIGKQISNNKTTNEPTHLILTSSFLNELNLSEEEGLLNSLKDSQCKTLLIYGHSNDETLEQQKETIKLYEDTIRKLDANLLQKMVFTTAKKRSHEKIIINSNADWFIGSWNAASSRPDSTQFEVGIKGNDTKIASELTEVIEEIIEDQSAEQFLKEFKEDLKKIQIKNNRISAKNHFNLLKKACYYLNKIIQEKGSFDNFVEEYRKTIHSIRLALIPFLKRSKIELINEHRSRDVLITQIRDCEQDIFLASDRVSSSALDSSIINDLLNSKSGKKKYLRILWGREWENEKSLSKSIREQLKEARSSLRNAMKVLGQQILTELLPMENHAKFALFDGARGLISSENILSYGGEKDKYESRELGVFIEGIPVIRYILGKSIKHRLKYFHPKRHFADMTFRPYEWIVEGIETFYSFQEIEDELDFEWDITEIIQNAINEDLFNPEDFLDEFDKMMHNHKIECFEERKNSLNQDFFDYLLDEGTRYYLLYCLDQDKWKPFTENLNLNKIEEIIVSRLPEIKEQKVEEEKSLEIKDDDEYKIDPIIVNEIMEDMVLIKKGCFIMGDANIPGERPTHKVNISEDFYMSKFVVTQRIWKKIMRTLPQILPKNISQNNPIINVSYNDAQIFLKELNALPNSGGFDLPTEAQWEYTCRAGTKTEYYFGNNPEFLEEFAWTKRNSEMKLHQVGLKKPNNWGLYDMHGLVYESLKDDLREFSDEEVIDPIGSLNSNFICYKGGAWSRYPINHQGDKKKEHFRSSFRDHHPKNEKSYRTSFRLIRRLPKK